MVGRKYLSGSPRYLGWTISGVGCTGNQALRMSPIQVGTILGLRMQVNLGVRSYGMRAEGLGFKQQPLWSRHIISTAERKLT